MTNCTCAIGSEIASVNVLGGDSDSTVTDDPDDTEDAEEETRVDTPIAQARLGLEDCPECQRTGALASGDVCPFCDGGRVVPKERADEWRARRTPSR